MTLCHAERAVLSILSQRGGKLPERKRKTATRLIEVAPDVLIEEHDSWTVPQFNSSVVATLQAKGLVQKRRIFIELTAAGRTAACTASTRSSVL